MMANYLERLDVRGNFLRRQHEDLARIDYVNLLGSFPAHHLVFSEASEIRVTTFYYTHVRDKKNKTLLYDTIVVIQNLLR